VAEPIIEQILANVATTVDGITVGAGYQQTLNAVRPTRLDLESNTIPNNGTVVVVCEDTQPGTVNAGNPARQEWEIMVSCIAYVIASDAVTTPIDTLINRVRADIEKALQVDHTRGGLAINTMPAGSQTFIAPGGSTSGVAVFSTVTIRTRLTDPYTLA
jgi:hypothetical protein